MYKINDTFYYDEDYINKVKFCNANNLTITEIGRDDKGRIYQIQEFPPKTNEELLQETLRDKIQRLEELSKDFIQIQAGFIIEDIEIKKLEFQTLLNDVRELQGKPPKQIK